MFADSTTDLILVIFDDSSLLIGLQLQVWSPIFIVWLSLSLISTDAMALHKPLVEQRQVEILVVVLATPNDFSVVWGL